MRIVLIVTLLLSTGALATVEVVDTSIRPGMPSVAANVTTIMIAEAISRRL
jgi:hypothetical protein